MLLNNWKFRLQCKCDATFYKCLTNLNSRYASAVAIGYGIVQSSCFEFEYPIIKCISYRCDQFNFIYCDFY